jgi:hypothetical protein
MPGKNPRISPLELRKQLLIAESDINRALLVEEAATVTAGVRNFADRARSVGSIFSAAASLVMGLSAFRRARAGDAGARPSWLQTILKFAPLIPALWMAFRSPARDPKSE